MSVQCQSSWWKSCIREMSPKWKPRGMMIKKKTRMQSRIATLGKDSDTIPALFYRTRWTKVHILLLMKITGQLDRSSQWIRLLSQQNQGISPKDRAMNKTKRSRGKNKRKCTWVQRHTSKLWLRHSRKLMIRKSRNRWERYLSNVKCSESRTGRYRKWLKLTSWLWRSTIVAVE